MMGKCFFCGGETELKEIINVDCDVVHDLDDAGKEFWSTVPMKSEEFICLECFDHYRNGDMNVD